MRRQLELAPLREPTLLLELRLPEVVLLLLRQRLPELLELTVLEGALRVRVHVPHDVGDRVLTKGTRVVELLRLQVISPPYFSD